MDTPGVHTPEQRVHMRDESHSRRSNVSSHDSLSRGASAAPSSPPSLRRNPTPLLSTSSPINLQTTIPSAHATSSSTSNSSPESSNRNYSPHIHSQSSSKSHTPQSADEFPRIASSHVQQGPELLSLVDPLTAYNQQVYQRMLVSSSSVLAAAAASTSTPQTLSSPTQNSLLGETEKQFLLQLQSQQQTMMPYAQPEASNSSVVSSTATFHLPPSSSAVTVVPPHFSLSRSPNALTTVESFVTVPVDHSLQPVHSRTSSLSSSTIEPSFHHCQFPDEGPELILASSTWQQSSSFFQTQPASHVQPLHVGSNASTTNSAANNPPSSRKKKEASSRQMKSQTFNFDPRDSDENDDSTRKMQHTKRLLKKQKRQSQVAASRSVSQQQSTASIGSNMRDQANSEAISISFHDEHTSSIDVVEVELMPPAEATTKNSATSKLATKPFAPPPFLRGGSSASCKGNFAKHARSTRHLTLDEVKSGQLRSVASPSSTLSTQDMSEQQLTLSADVVPVTTSWPLKQLQFATNGIHSASSSQPPPSPLSGLSKFTTQCYYLALLVHQHTHGTMPEANALMMKHWFTAFLDAYLRGWGQVVFQNNPLTGVAIIIAMLINNVWIALMGIYATFISTLFAKLLGLNPGAYQAGLFGYNAVLVGLGIATFDTSAMGEWNVSIMGPIGLMSMFSVIALVALGNVLGKFHVTPLTLPFNISAIFYLVGAVSMNYFAVPFYSGASGPKTIHYRASEPLPIDWGRWFRAIPIGVGQVFLAGELSSGILCILGIAICSPWSAFMSFLGSMVGQLAALGLGIDTAMIYGDGGSTPAGLYGYNSVLGAIAIGGFFYLPNLKSTCMSIFCAAMCAVLQACFKTLFNNWGGFPTLTFPFCITTLFFLLLHYSMPNMLIPIPLAILTYPEEHRHRYWIHKHFLEKVKHAAGFIQFIETEEKEQRNKDLLQAHTTTYQLENNTLVSAMKQSILAKKAPFQAMPSTSKRALIQPMNKDALSTESTEALYYKAELSRHYSDEEIEQRSTACRDFLDQLFDLLDPDGGASCITFRQLRASLNQVLGNTHTTHVISTQQMAVWMLAFENRDMIAQRLRKRDLKKHHAADDSESSSSSDSSDEEDEMHGPLADWHHFLSLRPSDIYIDYDDLFQLFMYYRPIDWKSQFLDEEEEEEDGRRTALSSNANSPKSESRRSVEAASSDTLLRKGNSVRFADVREEAEEDTHNPPSTANI